MRDLRSDIHQLINAIRDQQATDRDETQADNFETNLPERIIRAEREINEYTQREERTYRKLELSAQYFLVIGAWLTFIAAFTYAGIAAYQWREMTRAADAAKDAATTARQALTDVQRAFITDSFADSSDNNFVKTIITLENSGTTPTKDMSEHTSWSGLRYSPLPEDFSFPDKWEPRFPHNLAHVVVVPKGKLIVMDINIPKNTIQEFMSKTQTVYFYVWGWATYRDIFQDTAKHTLRFCQEMDLSQQDKLLIRVRTFDGSNEACAKYNCIDEQCENRP